MANFDVKVKVDPSQAEAGTKKVENALGGISNAADRVGALIKRAFGFLAIGAGITAGIMTLASFSQEMSTVSAITGATTAQFQVMKDVAQDLGATTRFSATQAAQGMTFLARAGFSTEQVLASIGDTLKLAQAGALDLGSAADIASNVLTGFRLNANEAGRVVDVLALASNKANTNVFQLGEAAKFVAPVAAGLKVSLEEATAAIGALSDAGLQGSLAGTGLKRILSELESPASNTTKILNRLGLSADSVKISQVGLTGALKTLREAGVDTGLALEIFGDRGGPAFEVLANAIPKVEMMTEKLQNAKGTADEMATVMDNNLNGALLSARSAVEALILSFGNLGAESLLTKFFRGLADLIRFVAKNLETLTGVILTAASAWGVYSLAAGGASSAMTSLIGVAGKVLTLFKGFIAAAAANPFGAIVAAIVVVIGLLATFSDKIMVGSSGITTLRDYAIAAFQLIRENIGPLIQLVRDKLTQAIDIAQQYLKSFGLSFGDILNAARTYVNTIIALYIGIARVASTVFKDVRKAILDAIGRNLVQTVAENFRLLVGYLIEEFTKFGRIVLKILDAVGLASVELADQIGVSLKIPTPRVPQGIKDYGSKIKDTFLEGFGKDYVGDFVKLVTPAFEAIDQRAQELAKKRLADQRAQEAIRTGAGAGVPTAGGPAADIEARHAQVSAIDDVIKKLKEEGRALAGTSAEREIHSKLIEIEKDLKRDLTGVEKQLITEQLRANQVLAKQGELYQQIVGPVDDYKKTQQALNVLLEQGRITAEQYGTALQQTTLAQGLKGVNLSLAPEGTDTQALSELQDQYAQRQTIIQEARDAELLTQQQYDDLSLQLMEKHNADIQQIEATRYQTQLRAGQNAFSALSGLAKNFVGEQSQTYRALFAISKGFAIAETTVAIAQGIANAAKLGWPANIPAIAAVIGQTAGLIGQIQGAQFTGSYQNGGDFRVGGAGGPDSQMVAFRASPNETVSIRTPGQARSDAAPQQQMAEPQQIQIVNVDDPGKLEDFMATPAGARSVFNVIKKNPTQVKQLLQLR